MKKYFVLIISLFLVLGNSLNAQKNELLVDSQKALEKGIEAHNNGKYEDAIKHYQTVWEADTNYITALYESAYSYTLLENYDEAIKICRNALKNRDNDEQYMFYHLLGVSLDSKGDYEEAIAALDEGIEKFPNYYLQYYTKGVVLQNQKKYDDSFEMFKKVLSINPAHFNSHFAIGKLAANQDEYTKASLAFSTAIVLEPVHSQALDALILLDELLAINYDAEPIKLKLSKDGEDDFSGVDKMIKSKVVIDKKYKTDSKFSTGMVKQLHAILETLEYDKKDKGWFMETYVPMYMKIKEQKKFNLFSSFLYVPSTNEQVVKMLTKDLNKLKEFQSWYGNEWTKLNNTIVVNNETKKRFFYSDGSPEGVGSIKDDRPFGYWELFYPESGVLAAKGDFDENGKTGEWNNYHANGRLMEKAEYLNGQINGKYFYYNEAGVLVSEGAVENGERTGLLVGYDLYGVKKFEENYINGKLEGEFKEFHPNGNLATQAQFKDNLVDGELTLYYPNKQIQENIGFSEGKKSGLGKVYHNNGQLDKEQTFKDGELNGLVKSYYKSGELDFEGHYKNGNKVGEFKHYYKNGQLLKEGSFEESGKQTGVEIFYDKKGNEKYEQKYKNGAIVEYKYFDRAGNILSEGKKKSNKFYFENRTQDNIKLVEGEYAVKGEEAIGLWKYYSEYGQLEQEVDFLEGGIVNTDKEYYTHGNIEREYTMLKESPQTVWGVHYYPNGNIARNGWVVDDKRQGVWEFFHKNGEIRTIAYYLNGEEHGPTYFYSPNGKIEAKNIHLYGKNIAKTVFDTIGNEIQKLDYLTNQKTDFEVQDNFGNKSSNFTKIGEWKEGAFQSFYGNGQLLSEGVYTNNEFDGLWKTYYPSGKLYSEVNYKDGEFLGKATFYYENGKIHRERVYLNNVLEGPNTIYYTNGEKMIELNHENGRKEGVVKYYNSNGVLQMEKYCENGKDIGYSYTGTDGKLVEIIPIPPDGNTTVEAKFSNGKTSRKYKLVNGKIDGVLEEYYENGQISEYIEFKMYYKHGTHKTYTQDGIVLKDITYEYDDIHGTAKTFYENGQLKAEEPYYYGERHGKSYFYNENGDKTLTRHYYYGTIIKEEKN